MYLLIENFNAGLDTRRMFLTSKAGSLQKCVNAHINRGGEIEKRKAFVQFATFPTTTVAGVVKPLTFGLQAAGGTLYTFGSADFSTFTNFPSNVVYQRLVHASNSALQMTKLVFSETFNGQVYAIADFEDGSTFHYLNGARVTSWDGITGQIASLDSVIASLASQIDADSGYSATSTNETRAAGTITITSATPTGTITGVTVGGKSLFALPLTTSTGDTSTSLASRLADSINNESNTLTGSFTIATSTSTASTLKWLSVGGKQLLGVGVASTATPANTATAIAQAINGQTTVLTTQITVSTSNASTLNTLTVGGTTIASNVAGVSSGTTGNTTTFATRIAAAINLNTSTTGFSATSSGAVVTITAPSSKTSNGAAVAFNWTLGSGITAPPSLVATNGLSSITMAGGLSYSAIANGAVVTITNAAGTRVNNGDAIAYSISGTTMTIGTVVNMSGGIGYTAVASGNVVTVRARPGMGVDGNNNGTLVVSANSGTTATTVAVGSSTAGVDGFITVTGLANKTYSGTLSVANNGQFNDSVATVTVTQIATTSLPQITKITLRGTFEAADKYTVTLTPSGGSASQYVLSGGSAGVGRTARTFNQKIYTTTKSLLYFSAIDNATNFGSTDDGSGRGLINMSNQDNGFEELQGTGVYQGKMAVLARRTVQIWGMDADPTKNSVIQTLKNVGTIAPRSVINFGDVDVFFLSDTGVRSLRARDASNAATVSDVGTNIDTLIQADLRDPSVTDEIKAGSVGIIEPTDGRYWLAIGSKIYVYSYFPTPGIAAWSTYEPGFTVENLTYLNGLIYCRANNAVYVYGGTDGNTYDNCQVEVVMPFLDGGKPAHVKSFQAIDMTCEGAWDVYAGLDSTAPDERDYIARIEPVPRKDPTLPPNTQSSTFDVQRIQAAGMGTHIGVSMKTAPDYFGYARISNFAAHFNINDAG